MRTVSAAALVSTIVLAAAGTAAAARPDPSQFFTWSKAHRLVHLTLFAGLDGSNNGFNFDGYGRGELLVRVPVGWRVVVDCENRGGMRHSCAIVKGALTVTPAFSGAATQALSPGSKAAFSFVARRVGTFRIACLVPGHEQARMWDVLDVIRGIKPSITVRAGP